MTGKRNKSGQAPDKQLACPLLPHGLLWIIIITIITTIYVFIYGEVVA